MSRNGGVAHFSKVRKLLGVSVANDVNKMQKPIFPLPEPVPDLILPGSVEYVRKHNPFRSAGPSPGIPAYDSSADPPGSRSGSRSGSRGEFRDKSRGKSRGKSQGLSSSGMGGLDLDAIDSVPSCPLPSALYHRSHLDRMAKHVCEPNFPVPMCIR